MNDILIQMEQEEQKNDIELNETTCSRISQTKQLRYELSESEIETNGVHLRVKIGIYNNALN